MLRDILKKEIISCSPEDSVREVCNLMDEEKVGAVMVLDGERRPQGIITDRDIVIRAIARDKDLEDTQVREIMTDQVHSVTENDGILKVLEVMRNSAVRRVPVVDDSGHAVGLLSSGDIFELLAKEISLLASPMTPEQHKLDRSAA